MERCCRMYIFTSLLKFWNTRSPDGVLGFFQTQIEKAEIPIRPLTAAAYSSRARSAQEIDDLEEKLKEHETRILQMNSSYERLQRRYLQLTELRHVLRESAAFFEQVRWQFRWWQLVIPKPSVLGWIETGYDSNLNRRSGRVSSTFGTWCWAAGISRHEPR